MKKIPSIHQLYYINKNGKAKELPQIVSIG